MNTKNVYIPFIWIHLLLFFHLIPLLNHMPYLSVISFFFHLRVLVVKNPPANAGDMRCIPGCRRHEIDPWVQRSPGECNDNPFQYACLENPMDRGAWRATVHGLQRVRHD